MNYNNNFNGQGFAPETEQKPKEPWYKRSDTEIPEGYNPYKEDQSVFTEIYRENKHIFAGPEPLQFETPMLYADRMNREKRAVKHHALSKLKKASGYVAALLLLFLLTREGLGTVIGLLSPLVSEGIMSEKTYTLLTDVFLVLQYIGVAAVVIYVMTIGRKNKYFTYLAKPEVSGGFIARWTVIAFGLVHSVAIIFNIIFELIASMGVHINELNSPLPDGIAENLLYFFAIVICAPIFEELMFRGLILTSLSKFGSWFAIIISGILFGLFHMNHQQLFFATAFGIILAYVDLRAKSVIPSIIAHTVFNGYSYVLGLVASFTNYEETLLDPSLELTGSTPALVMYGALNLLAYAGMLIAIGLLIREIITNRDQFSLPKGDSGLKTGEKFTTFISHPLTVTYLIIIFFYIMIVSFVDMETVYAMYEEALNTIQ